MKQSLSHARDNFKFCSWLSLIFALFSVFSIIGMAQTRSADSADLFLKSKRQVQAFFTHKPNIPVAGEKVEFADSSDDQSSYWKWDFGDGRASAIRNPRHTFSKPGFFSVTLTVGGRSGSRRVRRIIRVIPPIAVSFACRPTSPKPGNQIQFTDRSKGSPTSWLWDFVDGTTSTAQNPTHAYKAPAPYTVILVARGLSRSSRSSRILTVTAAAPESGPSSSFTCSPGSPMPGQAVHFTDTSAGTPASRLWDFTDGSTGAFQNPIHAYGAAGTCNVTLSVTNSTGSDNTCLGISAGLVEVITAASPSYADVHASIAIANPGDTVIVPAGSATWNSILVITKGINLLGAGIGQTVITSSVQAPANYFDNSAYMIVYEPSNPSANEPFRLSGFSFNGAGKCHWLKLSNREDHRYRPNKIRIDHNYITGSGPWPTINILMYGQMYGVADNNHFVGGMDMRAWSFDSSAWTYIPFSYGTADNFYLEDNIIDSDGNEICYGEAGAVYCIRYNTINLSGDAFSLIDAHGNSAWASTMGLEVYENSINANGHGMSLIDHRGGMGLVFNNTVSNTSSTYIQVREEFLDSLNSPANNLVTGQPQHISDSYYWNNVLGGNLIPASITGTINYGGVVGIVPQWNRDCWQQVSSFDGTSGIGLGPLSARPTTCTKGVGYWATDTKTLYKATATNTWTAYYTPYTYPHPLRAEK